MDDSCGAPPLCAGADDLIGPPTGLAEGWRLCIATHSRPQCRAGVFARRLGFAASQGFPGRCKHCRPQATFRSATGTKCRLLAWRSSPTKHRAGFCRGLQDISDAKWQCTPPLPSVTPPLAGEALGGLPLEKFPHRSLRGGRRLCKINGLRVQCRADGDARRGQGFCSSSVSFRIWGASFSRSRRVTRR